MTHKTYIYIYRGVCLVVYTNITNQHPDPACGIITPHKLLFRKGILKKTNYSGSAAAHHNVPYRAPKAAKKYIFFVCVCVWYMRRWSFAANIYNILYSHTTCDIYTLSLSLSLSPLYIVFDLPA